MLDFPAIDQNSRSIELQSIGQMMRASNLRSGPDVHLHPSTTDRKDLNPKLHVDVSLHII